MSQPVIESTAACDMLDTGQSIYEKSSHQPLVPASAIKLMSLYLSRKWVTNSMLDDNIEFTSQDTSGGSSAQLQVGDILTWRDLFHGLMLPSGNDAAQCLSRLVGEIIIAAEGGQGTPRARFISSMGEVASEDFAWTGAVFASPSGLERNSRLSAQQLCQLALALDPTAVQIAGRQSWEMTITGTNARTYTITHSVSNTEPIPFPEMVAAKSGTLSSGDPLANVVMLWDDSSGRRHATATLHAWPSDQRYVDLRTVMDYSADQDPSPMDTYRVNVDGASVDVISAKINTGAGSVTLWG